MQFICVCIFTCCNSALKDWHLKTYILKYRWWQNRMNRLQLSEVFSNRPKYTQCSVLQTMEKICLFTAFLWQFPTWNWYSSRQAHFYPNKCIIVNRSTTPPRCIKTNNCQKELIQATEATQSIFCKMTTPTVKPNPLSIFKRGPWNTTFTTLPHLTTQRNFFLMTPGNYSHTYLQFSSRTPTGRYFFSLLYSSISSRRMTLFSFH